MLKSLFIMNSRDVMHITRQVMTGGDSMARVLLWLMLFWASGLQWAVIASEMNTLMGIAGSDFVLLGGDNAFFRSVVVMDAEYRKVVELSENILVAASGDQGDVEMFVEWLKRNICLMRLESSRPVSARTVANFARRSLADKLRKQGPGQSVTALLGGWDKAAGESELFWLDAMGALQKVPFGAHGLASRFALSLLDNGYQPKMSLAEARELMETCFQQLDNRYLVSSVGFTMKVVDKNGCRDVPCKGPKRRHRVNGGEHGEGVRGGGLWGRSLRVETASEPGARRRPKGS